MTTQQRRPERRPETAATTVSSAADKPILKPLAASALIRAEVARILARVDVEEPIRRRVVQDALSQAAACTWWRKSELYEWARPRPTDFNGNATPAELAERDRKLAAQALAFRHKAELLQRCLLDEFEVA